LGTLVKNVNQLRRDAIASDTRHKEAIARARAEITAQMTSIEASLTEQTKQLREAQTGGLWQAVTALALISLGTILSGWSLFLSEAPTPVKFRPHVMWTPTNFSSGLHYCNRTATEHPGGRLEYARYSRKP